MGYQVTVTFDLEDCAKPSYYEAIKVDLARLKLYDHFKDANGAVAQLPRNTFAGELEGENAATIAAQVSNNLRRTFNCNNLSGPFFIAVGDHWAIRKEYANQRDSLRALQRLG